MTEAEKLAALDRAATQGVWATGHELEGNYLYAGENQIACISSPSDNGRGGDTFIRGESEAVANTDLIVALVNLYRAGRIAVIDKRAVEALRANKQGWENAIELDLLPSRHHDTARALIEQCTAAIAALGVKP